MKRHQDTFCKPLANLNQRQQSKHYWLCVLIYNDNEHWFNSMGRHEDEYLSVQWITVNQYGVRRLIYLSMPLIGYCDWKVRPTSGMILWKRKTVLSFNQLFFLTTVISECSFFKQFFLNQALKILWKCFRLQREYKAKESRCY